MRRNCPNCGLSIVADFQFGYRCGLNPFDIVGYGKSDYLSQKAKQQNGIFQEGKIRQYDKHFSSSCTLAVKLMYTTKTNS